MKNFRQKQKNFKKTISKRRKPRPTLCQRHFAVCFVKGQNVSLDFFPYRVQIMGGIVLHHGDVPEMRTGEGKTLTATMPVYLNAISGEGVHVITVNEYLFRA